MLVKAYEVDNGFLLSKPPTPFDHHGLFNYGVCELIENCPPRLLIVAEND